MRRHLQGVVFFWVLFCLECNVFAQGTSTTAAPDAAKTSAPPAGSAGTTSGAAQTAPTNPADVSATVADHPLYQYLKRKREEEWYRRLFFGFHFDVLQLAANTTLPVRIGTGNFVPAIGIQGEFWPWRNWGIRTRWTKAIISYFPSVDPNNRSFRTVNFLTPDLLFRWYLQSTSQASYLQFGLGFHYFSFDLKVDPAIPFVTGNRGIVLSVERKLAFNKTTGLRGNFDIIPLILTYPLQEEWIDRKEGLGLHFSAEAYHTVLSDEGVETLISLIYSQYDYLYETTEAYRNAIGKSEYQQHFRSLQLQLAARF